MKEKYGIFAEESGEIELIHTGSVRFSRANRFALRVMGRGVFFAHYHTIQDPPTLNEKGETVLQSHIEPVGERHKPKHIEKPDWKAVPGRVTDIERDIKYMNAKPAKKFDTRKRRPRNNRALIEYNEADMEVL